jgi:hypothetical protein
MRRQRAESRAARYDRQIRGLVREAVSAGATRVAQIAPLLPGVFPVTIARWARLSADSFTPKLPGKAGNLQRPSRPVAHPLDYDWRFTRRALERLGSEVERLDGQRRGIACLGCPSVAQYFEDNGAKCDNRDLNLPAGGRWNAFERLPRPISAGVVVMDPPWYNAHFREFLWSVRTNAGEGTDVLMAAPPWATRPGCREEIRSLMLSARRMGFKVLGHHECALPYLAPLFELNVLRVNGLADVPLDWRRADLWHLRLVRKGDARPPRSPGSRMHWEERQFGDVRIKVRRGPATRPGSSRLVPLGETGILTSVSSREPLRRQANVVTTGGRHFISNDPDYFFNHTCQLDSQNPQTPAQRQLTAIIADEQAEILRYHHLVSAFDRA